MLYCEEITYGKGVLVNLIKILSSEIPDFKDCYESFLDYIASIDIGTPIGFFLPVRKGFQLQFTIEEIVLLNEHDISSEKFKIPR